MKFERIIVAAGIAILSAATCADAGPARFWISTSEFSPVVPEAATINAAVGRQQTLYIWAQPATDGQGIRALQNFSLDIVTQTAALAPESEPFIDFIDGTFKIYNDPVINGKQRFQYTTDSFRPQEQGGPLLSEKTESQVLSNQPDAIKGLQGLSLENDNVVGIGHISDPNCVTIGSCSAWRIAEFAFKPLQTSGTNVNMLYLQIGFAGMTSERAGGTDVLFGNNASPLYNAGNTSHRQVSLATDSFDLQVIAAPFTAGDDNSDGTVGPGDYNLWRSTFGHTITAGEGADGNGSGIVDAADYVFWRKKMTSGSGAGTLSMVNPNITVPEPGATTLASILFVVTPLLRLIRQRRTISAW